MIARQIIALTNAAKKHHTEVNASYCTINAMMIDAANVIPMVRDMLDVDTKSGTKTATMYASTISTDTTGFDGSANS